MSAWDITGAVMSTLLTLGFGLAAAMPNKPPKPAYGETEAFSLFFALVCLAWLVFCIARLCGAHI